MSVTALIRFSSVEVLEAFFLQLVHRHAILALLFGLQVELFELAVGEHEEVAQFGGHRVCLHSLTERQGLGAWVTWSVRRTAPDSCGHR